MTTHILFASAMGVLAYLFIAPILVVAFVTGYSLTFSSSRKLANIPGGVLLFYVYTEFRSRNADSSLTGIAVVTDIIAVIAVLSILFFAMRSSRDSHDVERIRLDLLFEALAIQFGSALFIYLALSLISGRLLWS
ncbi:hypothetical protein BH11VER1_BH11VER1_26390 [soil metagenome]